MPGLAPARRLTGDRRPRNTSRNLCLPLCGDRSTHYDSALAEQASARPTFSPTPNSHPWKRGRGSGRQMRPRYQECVGPFARTVVWVLLRLSAGKTTGPRSFRVRAVTHDSLSPIQHSKDGDLMAAGRSTLQLTSANPKIWRQPQVGSAGIEKVPAVPFSICLPDDRAGSHTAVLPNLKMTGLAAYRGFEPRP